MKSGPWISLDLDDVLVDFLSPFLVHLNAVANTSFVPADVTSNQWSACVDRDGRRGRSALALDALDRMIRSDDLLHLEVRSEVRSALERLKARGARIIVNTHRRYRELSVPLNHRFEALTHQWLQTHLGEIVDAVEIVTGAAGKLEVCERYRACVHCDDRVSNLLPIAEKSRCRPVLLSAPWNAAWAAPDGAAADVSPHHRRVTRVSSIASMFNVITILSSASAHEVGPSHVRTRRDPRRPQYRTPPGASDRGR